jgi:Cd2+/Zn2+-exporting ATPase
MDLQEALTRIGFTEYEAKVYLALLREHPATGYQLSKASGVPRSMVYETLKRLHQRGAALETVEGRATLYRPLPPQTLLAQHESEHERLLRQLRQGLERAYTATTDERVWTLRGRATVLAYARQLLQEAAGDVYLVLGDPELDALRPTVTAAVAAGTVVNTLLIGEGTLDVGQVARHPPRESELQELIGMLLVAVEGGELLVASDDGETRATATNNADLIFIARQFVWMELFTQRIYARLGDALLAQLAPEDREILASGARQERSQPGTKKQ